MKVTAVMLFHVASHGQDPVLLGSAMDLSSFSFFERKPAREFLLFSCRTVAMKTEKGVRQSVKEGEYVICSYNKDGLCGLICTNDAYPRRSAFTCVQKVIEEYDESCTGRWKFAEEDNKTPIPCLEACLKDSQDPVNVDKFVKVKSKIDETKSVMETNIRALLDRGETLESMAQKSEDLSMESKIFAKRSKDLARCCTIL